jgi:hypothetical protein
MEDETETRNPRAAGLASQSPGRILLFSAIVVVTGSAVAVFHQFNPAQHNFFPRCWLHSTTGLLCPGCGGQRAVHSLLHGDFAGAAQYNLMLVLALVVGAGFSFAELHRRWRKLPPRLPRRGAPRMVWFFLAAFLLFGIARNLPFAPFIHLAP